MNADRGMQNGRADEAWSKEHGARSLGHGAWGLGREEIGTGRQATECGDGGGSDSRVFETGLTEAN